MLLREYGADVDYRIDVGIIGRVSSDRRALFPGEGIAEHTDRSARLRRLPGGRKDEDTPASIGFDDVTEMHRLGVGKADHRRGMKARTDGKAGCQMLMPRLAGD